MSDEAGDKTSPQLNQHQVLIIDSHSQRTSLVQRAILHPEISYAIADNEKAILACLTALFVTLMAVPIYVFVFGGATGHFSDMMTAAFVCMGNQLIVAVFSSNIIVSLADKIISAFVALAVLEALPPMLTSHLDIVKAPRAQLWGWIAGGVVVGAIIAVVVANMAAGG